MGDAFAAEGITVSFYHVRRSIGMGGDKLMPAVSGIEEATEQGKALLARYEGSPFARMRDESHVKT